MNNFSSGFRSTNNGSLVGLMITFNTKKISGTVHFFMKIKFVWSFLYFSTQVSKKCDNFELIYQSLGCIVLWNKNAIKAFLSAGKIINLNFLSKIQPSSSCTTSILNFISQIEPKIKFHIWLLPPPPAKNYSISTKAYTKAHPHFSNRGLASDWPVFWRPDWAWVYSEVKTCLNS